MSLCLDMRKKEEIQYETSLVGNNQSNEKRLSLFDHWSWHRAMITDLSQLNGVHLY
ncbi:hypothetical protein [Bacillus sp. SA1-12]|uniref:hypothetical protein n=1 Tax=Bacillus sp. SA1-12 TaxID=1455638 RepID=UPI0012E0B0BF|nr:hypothetical protein [Bacillus sp. SA1-12]